MSAMETVSAPVDAAAPLDGVDGQPAKGVDAAQMDPRTAYIDQLRKEAAGASRGAAAALPRSAGSDGCAQSTRRCRTLR